MKMLRFGALVALVFVLLSGVAGAQTFRPASPAFSLAPAGTAQAAPFVNPSRVAFLCPDHAADTEHELDVVRASDGVVVATILLGDPAINAATGEVEADVNVQPITFGEFRFAVRAVAAGLKSDTSEPSDVWRRAPGAPGKPRAISRSGG